MSAIQKEPGVVSLNQDDPEKVDDESEKKKRVYKDFGHENDGPTSLCQSLFTRFSASLTIIFRGSCRYEHSSYHHKPIFLMSSLSHAIDRIKGGGLVR